MSHVEGGDYLSDIISAIKNRLKVRISHQRFDHDTPIERIVHPYMLKEFRNRWYLIGMSDFHEDEERIVTYGLDRITALEVMDEDFKPAGKFSAKEHFRNCYGITSGTGKPMDVRLQFSAQQGMYVKTQPLHHSQREVKDTKNMYVIDLKVVPAYEFYMQILSYGPEVKVLKPKRLKEEIKKALKETLQLYK
ncbi:WYL domain-containing protein [Candidatus Amoebophilus asiaticus]|nr:WYL domain-containing protein [Candidatus Amoebophilus asiaticus]